MTTGDISDIPKYTKIGIERNVVISVVTANRNDLLSDVTKKRVKPRRKVLSYFFKAHTGSLLLILGAYTTIIFIACTILVLSVFKLENLTESNLLHTNTKNDDYSDNNNKSTTQSNNSVKLSNKLFREFIWPYKDSSLFNCSILNQIKNFKFITSGWTKNVFSFYYNGQSFALKTVNLNGNDLKSCLQTNTLKTCYEKASSKMYKEYILSRELSHANIVQVHGWCVSNDSFLENVAIITELCSPINKISLLQMPFSQRLHVIFNIMKLVTYLSASSLGSVAINDFRSEQFVLCGTTPKLTDLDDLSIEEPLCKGNEQCSLSNLYKYLKLPKNYTHNGEVECHDFMCIGYNEKQNIMNVYRHFIHLFLSIGVPVALKEDVESFVETYPTIWDAKLLLKEMKHLYMKFNSTSYSDVKSNRLI